MISFIRHAESTYNTGEDCDGDVSITKNGIVDSSYLLGKYDLVICSSLKRAIETLQHSNITYDNVIYSDLCREKYEAKDKGLNESNKDFDIRVSDFRDFLNKKRSEGIKIAVISHSHFLFSLTGHKFYNCELCNFSL